MGYAWSLYSWKSEGRAENKIITLTINKKCKTRGKKSLRSRVLASCTLAYSKKNHFVVMSEIWVLEIHLGGILRNLSVFQIFSLSKNNLRLRPMLSMEVVPLVPCSSSTVPFGMASSPGSQKVQGRTIFSELLYSPKRFHKSPRQ